MKRIVTVQDISCIGKCSLTTALPVISAMGVETAVLPTAVLSTHTAFKNFTFRDLTDDILPVLAHWKKENFTFDAIYTGYLGSFKQLELMNTLFTEFGTKKTLLFVDPCMADNGALYPGFTPEFAAAMAKLAGKADVIVPNLTEASYLLGIPYRAEGYDEAYIRDILLKLAALGAGKVVVKGVSFEPEKLGIMSYDSTTKEFSSYFHEKIPQSFHGTGDIFASVCVGALMRGLTLGNALRLAADFVVRSIKETTAHKDHNWYGVDFESAFPFLLERLQKEARC
ncbi:MAG: pyridoxamine kinase [Treponema sp.]|jgi:pyridoxine kinase|nr:pyridoxamine kinase [Treponema sp.]